MQLQGLSMFRPISIDPISSESSGLGLTVLELPPDAILYQIQLDRSYVMVREQWTSVLQVIVSDSTFLGV